MFIHTSNATVTILNVGVGVEYTTPIGAPPALPPKADTCAMDFVPAKTISFRRGYPTQVVPYA